LGEIRKQDIISLCGSLRGNETAWIPSIKQGRKYDKVDVGSSGKYMVEKSTHQVYGIKAYGVIHRGHYFGTLAEFIARAEVGLVNYKARNAAKVEPILDFQI